MIENNEGKKEIKLDRYEKQLFANLKMKSIIIINLSISSEDK